MFDKIIRSERRTLSIQIENDGTVVVRAPVRMPELLIRQFVAGKSLWIERHRCKLRQHQADTPKHSFISGDSFYFLGEKYGLELKSDAAREITLEGNFHCAPANAEVIRKRLRRWYRKEAYFYLTEHLNTYAEKYALPYNELKINSASRRWGSCSAAGNINFPWRIMMCPENIIDYIIVHEMAHLKHLNHSPRFWREVEKLCPTWRDKRKWLYANEHKFGGF
ncbi:MAG: SprT family zinc-dependent metalloprotease [Victivallales bacterium]|nr:SprT family zinc-dependent metalloprotease [Victivallales bacterium]